jgi:hypothetical protein
MQVAFDWYLPAQALPCATKYEETLVITWFPGHYVSLAEGDYL